MCSFDFSLIQLTTHTHTHKLPLLVIPSQLLFISLYYLISFHFIVISSILQFLFLLWKRSLAVIVVGNSSFIYYCQEHIWIHTQAVTVVLLVKQENRIYFPETWKWWPTPSLAIKILPVINGEAYFTRLQTLAWCTHNQLIPLEMQKTFPSLNTIR